MPDYWEIRGVGDKWDDLRFPVTAVNPPGNVSDPDIDPTTGLLLFAHNATNLVYIVAQMPHEWHEGSGIRPHIHWMKTTTAQQGPLHGRCAIAREALER